MSAQPALLQRSMPKAGAKTNEIFDVALLLLTRQHVPRRCQLNSTGFYATDWNGTSHVMYGNSIEIT